MRLKLFGLLLTALFFFTIDSYGQNTSSLYSMFGIGELDNRSYGLNSGMGGTGIGMRSNSRYYSRSMNTSNPASLAAIDTLTFVLDISTAARFSHFKSGSRTDNATDMSLKKLAIGFRVLPKWAMSLGLRPYSNVGYKIQSESPVEGSSDVFLTDFEGSGGLSRLYSTNEFRLTNNLSIGVNASLLFGRIEHTESQSEFYIERTATTRKFYFDFGAQYTNTLNQSTRYTIGAVYGYKANIKLSNEIEVTSQSTGNVLESETKRKTETSVPQYFGGGASVTTVAGSKVFTFAADYLYENWANIKNPFDGVRYANSHKGSIGVQYLPNWRMPKNYWQRIEYQIGGSYGLSGVQIRGQQMREYAFTLGAILPVYNSFLHFSAELGRRTGKGLMKENYMMFTLGFSFNEMWFFKRFYD